VALLKRVNKSKIFSFLSSSICLIYLELYNAVLLANSNTIKPIASSSHTAPLFFLHLVIRLVESSSIECIEQEIKTSQTIAFLRKYLQSSGDQSMERG
jgi:hypothetical protein